MLVRGFVCAVLTVPVLGCGQTPTSLPSQELPVEAGTEGIMNNPAAPHLEATVRPATRTNLVAGTRLSTLAERIDAVAIVRSSAVQQVRAAEAELQARRFDNYPQLRPTASAPLTAGVHATTPSSSDHWLRTRLDRRTAS
jgi:hypothetical protein